MIENKTYVGIVEDNLDPKKIGRVKVRVMDVFDEIPLDEIPWSMPWKDLNGNQFIIPDIGKVVMVVFDQGNIKMPEYIYADNYNINLEEKLLKLEDSDYSSMKSLLFDHKTQIYVNNSEGLKIDHKFNNLNIKEGSINLNLKDNNSILNLGDSTASQQSILGNNFIEWMSEFINVLESGALFNSGGPVKPDPRLIKVFTKFKALKNEKFLSHHVNIVDNNKISTVLNDNRENNSQIGDNWTTTSSEPNELSFIEENDYEPVDGLKQDYDSNYIPPSTNGEPDDVLNNIEFPTSDQSNIEDIPLLNKLVKFIQSKKYIVYDQQNILNIVAMRKDTSIVSNKFDERLFVFYKNTKNKWVILDYQVTTTPGFRPKTNILPEKVAILALGQYIDQYKLGFHQNKRDHKCLKFSTNVVHRNDKKDKYNFFSITEKGSFGINIHRSSKNGSSENIYNWSQGCQVFKNSNQFDQFIKLCDQQDKIKKTFTYTLIRKGDFDSFKI